MFPVPPVRRRSKRRTSRVSSRLQLTDTGNVPGAHTGSGCHAVAPLLIDRYLIERLRQRRIVKLMHLQLNKRMVVRSVCSPAKSQLHIHVIHGVCGRSISTIDVCYNELSPSATTTYRSGITWLLYLGIAAVLPIVHASIISN